MTNEKHDTRLYLLCCSELFHFFSEILVADVDVIFDLLAQTVTRRYIYNVFESVFSIKKLSNASNFS